MSRPRSRAPALLLAVVLFVTGVWGLACSGGAGGPEGGGSQTTSVAPHSADSPPPDALHGKHVGSKCAECHTAEERAKPEWRQKAVGLGHDVSGMIGERKTCTCCHLGEVKGFGDPLEERCLDCHAEKRVTIPKMASQHCVGCHRLDESGPAYIATVAWECKRCHEQKQGESAAIDVHATEDCASCHKPHDEPWVKARVCTECHEKQEGMGHGHLEGKEQAECVDCHAPHEKAGEASAKCIPCHQKKDPKFGALALFTMGGEKAGKGHGHEACTTCHAPHSFEKKTAADCTSCHREHTMEVEGAKAQGAHKACESCHDPHAVRETAGSACKKCHEKVSSSHPDPKHLGCTGCHAPHPNKLTGAIDVGCSTCHTTSKQAQAGDHGDLTCNKCHTVHNETTPSGCNACHAKELAAVQLSPNAGHADCKGCHTGGAHRPGTNIGACGSCHANEVATAPKGHNDCAKCHDAHKGTRAATATCTSCHPNETRTAVALGHKDCESCHRTHGGPTGAIGNAAHAPKGPASPPACITCHPTNKLPGLHSFAESTSHGTCTTCHATPHTAPNADRATCVGCHANEKDHKPDAKKCSGCHRFTQGG